MRDFPVHVEFELTNHCNLACKMCPRENMTRKCGFMDIALFKRAIDQCRGKVKFSYLHQIGEPLLYPHLLEAINYAESAEIKASISTNCHFLMPSRVENLLKSRLSEIILCIDSFNPEKYSQIRINGNFKIVMDNIEYFLQRHVEVRSDMKVIVQIIRMSDNKDELGSIPQLNGNYELWIKPFSTFAGAVDDPEKEPSRRLGCAKPFTHMTVQWNGDVVPCCRDYDGVLVMGNINDQNIADIWNSSKYESFRNNFKDSEFCKEC